MPPSFLPGLINDASGDPGLFISFAFNRRAVAFDLGDIAALSPRDSLKISHVFITHTHMDHFAGFDRLLRIMLGRSKTLYLYGPEGFLRNLEGKLSAYTWNLVQKFTNQLIIYATELTETKRITRRYACRDGFQPDSGPQPSDALPLLPLRVLYQEPSFNVSASILDHGIPCLGFSLKENFRINIRKERLEALGFVPGPWLQRFKQAVYDGQDPEWIVPVMQGKNHSPNFRHYTIKELLQEIAMVGKGQKISYIADAAYHPANVEKMIGLAKDADHLFIEAAFLEKDREHALKKHHLTARQAGEIAGKASVRRFTLFHFSPRYQHSEKLFYTEAMEAYSEQLKGIPGIPDA